MIQLFAAATGEMRLQRRLQRSWRRPSRRSPNVLHVDPVEQHRERRCIHLGVFSAGCNLWKAKSPVGQSLVVEDESVAIPRKDFYAVQSLPQEDEQMPIKRIEPPRAAHD